MIALSMSHSIKTKLIVNSWTSLFTFNVENFDDIFLSSQCLKIKLTSIVLTYEIALVFNVFL